MKKILLTLSAALILVGCNKLSQAQALVETVDSLMNATDSIHEEGEPDGSEAMGLSPYEQQDFDLSELPSTAEEQDRMFNHVLYVNVEQEPTEDDPAGLYTSESPHHQPHRSTCMGSDAREECQWCRSAHSPDCCGIFSPVCLGGLEQDCR